MAPCQPVWAPLHPLGTGMQSPCFVLAPLRATQGYTRCRHVVGNSSRESGRANRVDTQVTISPLESRPTAKTTMGRHGVDARPALGKQALAPTSRSSSLSRRSAIITRIILAMHVTGAAASRDEVTSCQRPTAEWLAIDQVCCASAAPCAPLTRLRKANAPLTRDVCFCRVRRPTERVTGKPSPRSAPKFS